MMENPRSDISLGAACSIIGVTLLMQTYTESASAFLLPGDISPYFTPKVFLFAWIAVSLGILVKGVIGLRTASHPPVTRNWIAIVGCFAAAIIATALMKSLGFLMVAPLAVSVSVWLLGYRNHVLNLVVSVGVPIGLYLMLVQLAGLPLPRAFWQG
jgi:ABC-type phosphate transport system permease subunit